MLKQSPIGQVTIILFGVFMVFNLLCTDIGLSGGPLIETCQSIGSWVGHGGRQAEWALATSTTSSHPAFTPPPIQALCKPPQGMQRGICRVYSPHRGFGSA